jgi:hypothetical protein
MVRRCARGAKRKFLHLFEKQLRLVTEHPVRSHQNHIAGRMRGRRSPANCGRPGFVAAEKVLGAFPYLESDRPNGYKLTKKKTYVLNVQLPGVGNRARRGGSIGKTSIFPGSYPALPPGSQLLSRCRNGMMEEMSSQLRNVDPISAARGAPLGSCACRFSTADSSHACRRLCNARAADRRAGCSSAWMEGRAYCARLSR